MTLGIRGRLYGIVGVALVLTYRTSRIINFAAAAVGAVPAITAVLLSTAEGINYLVTMPIAYIGVGFLYRRVNNQPVAP